MREITRAAALAYRAAAHDLESGSADPAVLGTGVQDTPPGSSARLAMRARGAAPDAGVLVHAARGVMHRHRAKDLDLLAAALRPQAADELAKTTHGGFPRDLPDLPGAVDTLAGAMRGAVDVPMTKGELSTAVAGAVDRSLTPWCAGCGAHHAHDGMFRIATLQAGLTLSDDGRFQPPRKLRRRDPEKARAELLHRFLALAGPANPADLAAWLAIEPAAARRWWALADLVEVRVDGAKAYALAGQDLDAPAPKAVRLLGPYDPLLELGDRKLVAPDPAHRKQIWRATANPGVLLVAGEVAGVWRQKTTRGRLELTVTTFGDVSAARRRAAEADAGELAETVGATGVGVRWAQ